MERIIPDFYIEQFILDELPENEMHLILSSSEATERINEIKRSNSEILNTYPPEEMSALIRSRLEERIPDENDTTERVSGKLPKWPVLLAAAVLVAVFGLFHTQLTRTGSDTGPLKELTRIKGAVPTISIYRKIPAGSEKLSDGSFAVFRDLIQIGYNPAGMQFGTIISIDGNGQVTLHYPEKISESKELASGGEILLPFSYELDDAPGFERFYFIASDKDFSLSQVILSAESVAAAREGFSMDTLPLPASFRQDSIVLIKE